MGDYQKRFERGGPKRSGIRRRILQHDAIHLAYFVTIAVVLAHLKKPHPVAYRPSRSSTVVVCVARQAHDLTGLRDIPELFRQIEKTDFVFDDLFITLKHEGYLSLCFDGWFRTAIKTGNPHPVQGTLSDQIETTSSNGLRRGFSVQAIPVNLVQKSVRRRDSPSPPFLLFYGPARSLRPSGRDPARHTARSEVLKQSLFSVVDYIATLPGFWQIVAYLSILALIVAFFRALPVIFEFLWYLILDALQLALKYLWYGLRRLSRHILGGIYQDGEGVLQDFAEAARWYHMAAEQGDVGAAPVAAQHKGQMFGGAPAAFDGDTLLVKPEGAPAIRIVEIAAT